MSRHSQLLSKHQQLIGPSVLHTQFTQLPPDESIAIETSDAKQIFNSNSELYRQLIEKNEQLTQTVLELKRELLILKTNEINLEHEAQKWEQKYIQLEKQKEIELNMKTQHNKESVEQLNLQLNQQRYQYEQQLYKLCNYDSQNKGGCQNCQKYIQEIQQLQIQQQRWLNEMPQNCCITNAKILEMSEQLIKLSELVNKQNNDIQMLRNNRQQYIHKYQESDFIQPTLK